jgi:hypothetical protein
MDVLDRCTVHTMAMKNRRSFLRQIIDSPAHPVVRFQYPYVPRGHLHFDRLNDTTAIENQSSLEFWDKLSKPDYERPMKVRCKPPRVNLNHGVTHGTCVLDCRNPNRLNKIQIQWSSRSPARRSWRCSTNGSHMAGIQLYSSNNPWYTWLWCVLYYILLYILLYSALY